eukprot:EG_transcript_37907
MSVSPTNYTEPSARPHCSHGRPIKNAWDADQPPKGRSSGISGRKHKRRGESKTRAADSPDSDESAATIYREPILRPPHPGGPRLGVSLAKFVGHFNPLHLAWRPASADAVSAASTAEQWLAEHSKAETRFRRKKDSVSHLQNESVRFAIAMRR